MSKNRYLEIDNNFNKTISDVFKLFLSFKESQGVTERTIKEYKITINKVLTYCNDMLTEENLTLGIIEYFTNLSNKSPATYNNQYKNLNCFFNWCILQEYISYNPLKKLGYKKKKETSRAKDIDINILKELLISINLNRYKGLRDYAIILISLATGVRPNELLNTLKSDFNFKSKELTIRAEVSKTRIQRILPLSNIVVDTLQKLIKVTPSNWKGNHVFYTVDGLPLKSSRWSKIMQIYSKKIDYPLSAYNLRHFFALNYLRNGGDIFSLQVIMGHSDLSMTKRYLALSQIDIQKQHKIATPINELVKRNTRIIKLFK